MPPDKHQELIERFAREAREGGLVVRCDHDGVLAMMHPRHLPADEKQPGLTLQPELKSTASAH